MEHLRTGGGVMLLCSCMRTGGLIHALEFIYNQNDYH